MASSSFISSEIKLKITNYLRVFLLPGFEPSGKEGRPGDKECYAKTRLERCKELRRDTRDELQGNPQAHHEDDKDSAFHGEERENGFPIVGVQDTFFGVPQLRN